LFLLLLLALGLLLLALLALELLGLRLALRLPLLALGLQRDLRIGLGRLGLLLRRLGRLLRLHGRELVPELGLVRRGLAALPVHAEEDEREEDGVHHDREDHRAHAARLRRPFEVRAGRRLSRAHWAAGRASSHTRLTWFFCRRSRTASTSS